MTRYLYRKLMQAVTLVAAVGVITGSIEAQYRTVAPPERKTPRAVAVLETFKDGKRRLVPVTFYYQKKFYDAALYRATPVPFTLYSETVYEVQQFGKPLGTFTLKSATRNGDELSKNWFGNGKFKAAAEEVKIAKDKVVVPVVVDDPSKPVLYRRAGSEGDSPASQAKTAAATKSAQPEEEDSDRPKLHRKEDSAAKEQAAQIVAAKSDVTPSDEGDHPVLRRGKPVEEQSGKDLPEMKHEEPVSRMVAVSDAASSELQPLIYVSNEAERNKLEAMARDLAQSELSRLAGQRGLALPGTATTVPKKAMAARTPAKSAKAAVALTLGDEQFVPYDLDYSNYATVVYSGRYAPEGTAGRSWVVTVVAREDEGKLVKLYSSVSDPRELDLYPEVRLVDALDPDGYGRAALLFREKKRDGVAWMLGRPTGYGVQTVFETAVR